jgi:hypothetical protein
LKENLFEVAAGVEAVAVGFGVAEAVKVGLGVTTGFFVV